MILDCNEVIPNRLWVGGYVRPEDVRFLRQMEITSVVNLQSDRVLSVYGIKHQKALKAFSQVDIELRGSPPLTLTSKACQKNLPQAVEELEKSACAARAKVYVHCSAGINRGPTLAAAYLIKQEAMSAQEAYDFLVARRDCNPYLEVLKGYEAFVQRSYPG
jgi:atypical dual specificity phosphatase